MLDYGSLSEPCQKTVAAIDKDGKTVFFHFQWCASALNDAEGGYAPYRLYIEPCRKRTKRVGETFELVAESGTPYRVSLKPAKGSIESFVFVDEDGEEVVLTITCERTKRPAKSAQSSLVEC